MIRSCFFLALLIALAMPVRLQAQDTAPLGSVDIAAKVGYAAFSEGVEDDAGIYLGVEGYGNVAPHVYVGAEASVASSIGIFSDEMSLGSFELNGKYAKAVSSNFVLAGGAGLSYSYAEFDTFDFFNGVAEVSDWLFGGQIFADLVFRVKWFDLGVNAKYQLIEEFPTADVEQVEVDFSNFRLGVQAGFIF